MNRYKEYQTDQSYLIPLNPSQDFPEGSYERFLVDTLAKIDIGHFYSKKDKGGETPHNPRAILGVLLYALSDKTYSYRQMAKYCLKDKSYIYLSGYTTPHYSTFSRFIYKFKENIVQVFKMIVYLAYEAGYINYNLTAIDGTKIKANASGKFSGTIKDFEKKSANIEKNINKALKKCQESETDEKKEYWQNKTNRYKKMKDKIDSFLAKASPILNSMGKEIHQNIIEPDCSTMKVNGTFGPCVNSQACVGENSIIIAADVCNEPNDKKQLQPMLNKIIETAPDKAKEKAKNAKHLADNGYNSIDNLLFAGKNDFDVYIPQGTTKKLYTEEKKIGTGRKIGIRDCTVEMHEGVIQVICPGKLIIDQNITKIYKGEEYLSFKIIDKSACNECAYFKKCSSHLAKNNYKTFDVIKKRIDNWDIIENARRKIESDDGQMIYSKRMGMIEKIFGHIKRNMGVRQFLVHGIDRMQSFWNVICISYNMKRMYKLQTTGWGVR